MDKINFCLILSAIILSLTACNRNSEAYDYQYYKPLAELADELPIATPKPDYSYDENYYIDYDNNTDYAPLTTTQVLWEPHELINVDLATQFLEELEAMWDADGGALWGTPLNVPFIIACGRTRHAVANMPDDSDIFAYYCGVYTGFLPDNIFIWPTSVNFGGRTWGMATWDYLEENANNKTARLRLMIHEGFHALQPTLLTGTRAGWYAHLNTRDNWLSTLLELHALLVALDSNGEERLSAIQDALSIRAARQQNLTPYEILTELTFEIVEGTAQYTEYLFFMDRYEILATIREFIGDVLGTNHAGYIWGYFSGLMYGLLLDDINIDWKTGLGYDSNIADLLMNALDITELRPRYKIDLHRYEYEKIIATEQLWFNRHAEIEASALALFASDNPVLEIPFDSTFNPIDFDYIVIDIGVVFAGYMEFSGVFGELIISGGYRLQDGRIYRICAASMEIDGNRIVGSHWELTLNESFEVIQHGNIYMLTGP